MYKYGSLINGDWVAGEGEVFNTYDPACTSELVGSYRKTSFDQLCYMGESAVKAQKEWAALTASQRTAIVSCFLDKVAESADAIANATTREQGKIIAESRGELSKALQEARTMLGEAVRSQAAAVSAQKPGTLNTIVKKPRGVIAAITPWNFPILTPMRKIAPALIFGNAIILKPADCTPAVACLIADASRGILPDGLLQVALGDGRNVGARMVQLPQVTGITFTGSVETGRKIYQMAATNLAEVSLELGGKNAVIINDTSDLDGCLDQVVGAAFACSGQRCTAISRIVVNSALHDQVSQGLVERLSKYKLGSGFDENTTMGPLTTATQLDCVEELVRTGVNEGAKVLLGGSRFTEGGLDQGYFYAPTILDEVKPYMTVAKEEIFGPVISIIRYETFDEAIDILNGVDFGLTSALFSNNNKLVQKFIEQSQNGMIHINHGTVPDDHMPFGGIKNSGVGAYSVGPSASNFYTTEHSVYNKYQ